MFLCIHQQYHLHHHHHFPYYLELAPCGVPGQCEVFMLAKDLNLLPLVDRALVDGVGGGKVDDLRDKSAFLPLSCIVINITIHIKGGSHRPSSRHLHRHLHHHRPHHHHPHLAKKDPVVHLLVHVGTVLLQRQLVVHILFK